MKFVVDKCEACEFMYRYLVRAMLELLVQTVDSVYH